MRNTLTRGDFILVNKVAYGARIPTSISDVPLLNLWSYNKVNHFEAVKRIPGPSRLERGDIVVFNNPIDPSEYMVKRCLALPYDRISVKDNEAFVNGREIRDQFSVRKTYLVSSRDSTNVENILIRRKIDYNKDWDLRKDKIKRVVLTQPEKESLAKVLDISITRDFTSKLSSKEFPSENGYFMMGDNRPYSTDSRFWGRVTNNLIVGKVQVILFSYTKDGGFRWDRLFKSVR